MIDRQDMIDQLMASKGKRTVQNYRPSPLVTRHIGTIAFQGTDKEIEAMQRRTFGKEERQ